MIDELIASIYVRKTAIIRFYDNARICFISEGTVVERHMQCHG